MNTKRIIFWVCFLAILVLIVWGLIVAMNKPMSDGPKVGDAPAVTAIDHIMGATSSKVTLIEYSDFQCPACGSYYPFVERLMSEASTTVTLVYRHYPLPQHPNAPLAARASEAASNQGKFWDMYRMLFEGQTEWSELADIEARKVFAGYASSMGLNMTTYVADLDSASTTLRVRSDADAAIAAGVNATPTFFLNGKAISTPQSYDLLKSTVEAAAK
jgi:protein-disulfide isomerase